MKKLLVMIIALVLVGCNSNEANVRPTETPEDTITPKPTGEVTTPHPDSKINIDLYKVDEYYPIVDGVVTYPDGTTEEFTNGYDYPKLGGYEEGESPTEYLYYEANFDYVFDDVNSLVGTDKSKHYLRLETVNDCLPMFVSNGLSDDYVFVQSSINDIDVIDGVFGIEYLGGNSVVPLPYVVYRYATHIPKGYDINDSFRIVVKGIDYYVWRMREFDTIDGFDQDGLNSTWGQDSRRTVIRWDAFEYAYLPPNEFTFK